MVGGNVEMVRLEGLVGSLVGIGQLYSLNL